MTIVAAAGNGQTARLLRGHLQAQPDEGREADHGPDAGGEAHLLQATKKASAAAKKKKKRRLWGNGRAGSARRASTARRLSSARSGWSRTAARSTLTRVARGKVRCATSSRRRRHRQGRQEVRARRRPLKKTPVLGVAAAALLACAFPAAGYAQTTYTVTRFDDPPPDDCLPTDCSLREALIRSSPASRGHCCPGARTTCSTASGTRAGRRRHDPRHRRGLATIRLNARGPQDRVSASGRTYRSSSAGCASRAAETTSRAAASK